MSYRSRPPTVPSTHATPGAGPVTVSILSLLVIASLAVPSAHGHGAPDPLEIETLLLLDEGEDAFLFVDGYDLYDLYVREAFLPGVMAGAHDHDESGDSQEDSDEGGDPGQTVDDPANETTLAGHDDEGGYDARDLGIILRFSLYGGFANARAAQAQHIDLGVTVDGEPKTFRLTTTDDQTWETELTITEHHADPDLANSWTQNVQVFASWEQLGAAPGSILSDFTMASYVDDELVDIAPGGHYLPRGGALVEVPRPDSERLVHEITLTGPNGYTNSSIAGNQGTIEILASSLLDESGQHVQLEVLDADGWTVGTPELSNSNLQAGRNVTIFLPATADPGATAPLTVAVTTDLGGFEMLHIGVLADGSFVGGHDGAAAPMDLDHGLNEEAPGPALAILLSAVLLAAAALRLPRKPF